MSKNKLAWIFALVLVFTVALPIAHAQVIPTGSRLSFILINAAIIFVVLFVLQAFLVQGKGDKEKTSMWIILVLASLLLAYFFGQSGLLWAEGQPLARFFNIKVLVNAVIIGAVLYFVLGFLLKDKVPKSPEGIGGYGILIFLVALVFAVQIGNQFIWHQSIVKQLVNYFFGPEGIMNPKGPEYRLWTLISSVTLFAFFFNNYLIKGGNVRLNYALAIVLGSNMASSGVSINSIIKIGEIVFTIILADTLGNTTTKNYAFNWILAALLVGWASYAITSGTSYSGIAGWVFGTGLPWAGWGIWQLLKFIIIAAGVVFTYLGIKKLISGTAGGTP